LQLGLWPNDRPLSLINPTQKFLAKFKVSGSDISQLDKACRPVKQSRPQAGLQLLNASGDHRAGHSHLIGRSRKASRAGYPNEAFHGFKTIHRPAPIVEFEASFDRFYNNEASPCNGDFLSRLLSLLDVRRNFP